MSEEQYQLLRLLAIFAASGLTLVVIVIYAACVMSGMCSRDEEKRDDTID